METPNERLVRAVNDQPVLRSDDADDDRIGTLFGHFTRFGEWTEIDSWYEGRFLERVQKGAFAKTFKERAGQIKVLFNHGHDTAIGRQILGVPEILREEDEGPYYETPLLNTSYNRDLLPGLRAGGYGASFMFDVIADAWNEEPKTSSHNPNGLPERTITETRLYEFGPVTFPAYDGATAGARSTTHLYLPEHLRTPSHPETGRDGAAKPDTEPLQHSGLNPNQRAVLLRQIQMRS